MSLSNFAHLLLALAIVVLLGQLLSRLLARVGQPPVIGEMLAGILLGPSLIGAQASALVLPPAVAPYLQVIAQLGVVLYMFCVGLELNAGLLRSRLAATLTIAQAGIVVPFGLGLALAATLYPAYAGAGVAYLPFGLFLGVALSVTAFPVLARILKDHDLTRSELGQLALGAAAAGDLSAWCLLAIVVGVASVEAGSGVVIVLGAGAYLAAMLVLVRPLLKRYVTRWEAAGPENGNVALIFVALLLSACATEAIGVHALFGAFLLGVLIPHDSRLALLLDRRLQTVVFVLLLPAFFAYTGMRTRLDLIGGAGQWALCVLIVLLATVGKLGGTYVSARLVGLPARTAGALGILMNTRGLMELIVLNIGLELKVITPAIYSMLVLMALVTTLLTSPLLRWHARILHNPAAAPL